MKRKILMSLSLIFIFGLTLFAQETKTEEFEVAGKCGMCKSRIEKAAKSVEGVSEAEWNKETKMLKLTFDISTTDVEKVHLAVARVGHDTPIHKADDEVYWKLPSCCLYRGD